jgi:hypothetical protein
MNDNYNMSGRDNEEYENILVLANLVEADLMEKVLTEEGIPFYIRPWHDINFDGIFAEQKGYGWLMGRRADEELVRRVYTDRISAAGITDFSQS